MFILGIPNWNPRVSGAVFFFPVNLESAREPHFFENFHGHIFAFTGTFWTKFTGKRMRSRALFWTFSRALLCGSRVLFCGSRAMLKFTGTQFSWFTATFEVHGYFFSCSRVLFPCSRADFCQIVHGQKKIFTGIFFKMFTGTFSRFTGEKNTDYAGF